MIIAGLAAATAVQAGNGRKEKKADAAVQGSVSDAATRKPLTGVTVSISGRGNDKKELAHVLHKNVFKSKFKDASNVFPSELVKK